jgi:hypothetical protein
MGSGASKTPNVQYRSRILGFPQLQNCIELTSTLDSVELYHVASAGHPSRGRKQFYETQTYETELSVMTGKPVVRRDAELSFQLRSLLPTFIFQSEETNFVSCVAISDFDPGLYGETIKNFIAVGFANSTIRVYSASSGQEICPAGPLSLSPEGAVTENSVPITRIAFGKRCFCPASKESTPLRECYFLYCVRHDRPGFYPVRLKIVESNVKTGIVKATLKPNFRFIEEHLENKTFDGYDPTLELLTSPHGEILIYRSASQKVSRFWINEGGFGPLAPRLVHAQADFGASRASCAIAKISECISRNPFDQEFTDQLSRCRYDEAFPFLNFRKDFSDSTLLVSPFNLCKQFALDTPRPKDDLKELFTMRKEISHEIPYAVNNFGVPELVDSPKIRRENPCVSLFLRVSPDRRFTAICQNKIVEYIGSQLSFVRNFEYDRVASKTKAFVIPNPHGLNYPLSAAAFCSSSSESAIETAHLLVTMSLLSTKLKIWSALSGTCIYECNSIMTPAPPDRKLTATHFEQVKKGQLRLFNLDLIQFRSFSHNYIFSDGNIEAQEKRQFEESEKKQLRVFEEERKVILADMKRPEYLKAKAEKFMIRLGSSRGMDDVDPLEVHKRKVDQWHAEKKSRQDAYFKRKLAANDSDSLLWFRRTMQPTAEFVVCFPLFGNRVYLGGTKKGELVKTIPVPKGVHAMIVTAVYSKERDVLTQAVVKIVDRETEQTTCHTLPLQLFTKKEDLEKEKLVEKEIRNAEKSSVVVLAPQIPFGGVALAPEKKSSSVVSLGEGKFAGAAAFGGGFAAARKKPEAGFGREISL